MVLPARQDLHQRLARRVADHGEVTGEDASLGQGLRNPPEIGPMTAGDTAERGDVLAGQGKHQHADKLVVVDRLLPQRWA
jgi:hypothetical protein